MKKLAIGGIFAAIAGVLFVVFAFLVYKLLKEQGVINEVNLPLPAVLTQANPPAAVEQTPWYVDLAKQKIPDFMPMSNELYIHFELANAGHSSKKKFFKLSIDKEDSYSLFCVKQTVAKLDLKYFFVNTKKNAKIIIDTTDVSMLHRLVDALKGYRIGSSFEEIWI